ncbi:unnamed protein product [Albugo candida]|uniref:Uncharacterized protein n=1 Tax=Albugo candida TaxID=65357 RepID=A0A024G230_9STRA|nr:unnamed protein product [Albugo candida]|eukprot:CCI40825.1 unnamed protein product [Albugo candida]
MLYHPVAKYSVVDCLRLKVDTAAHKSSLLHQLLKPKAFVMLKKVHANLISQQERILLCGMVALHHGLKDTGKSSLCERLDDLSLGLTVPHCEHLTLKVAEKLSCLRHS